jgi:hypothetical protein
MRFNKFYKYTIGEDKDNSNRISGENFANYDDDTKEEILEKKVFTVEENLYFTQTITQIIEFAKEKLSNDENRNDRDKIILMLDKIKNIDINMNRIFNENVKTIREQFKKTEYTDPVKHKENKKSKNEFIMNLVKLQNSLFTFQIRIIFTQITQINNIINRRLLIIEEDKQEFIKQINNLLDIVNQKVTAMNEYLEVTTDEEKNLIPLTKEYKFNEYEYLIDPETKKKEIILRKEKVSANELSEPGKDVLKIIDQTLKNPNSDGFNTRFPTKYLGQLLNESGDPDYDKPEDKDKEKAKTKNADLFLHKKDINLLQNRIAHNDTIDNIIKKIDIDFKDDDILPIKMTSGPLGPQSPGAGPQSPGAGPQSPGAGLQSQVAGQQTEQTGGVKNINNKNDLLSTIKSDFNLITNDPQYINQYIISNFYFINKLSLYIFNDNKMKQIMLLFLTPDILVNYLLNN